MIHHKNGPSKVQPNEPTLGSMWLSLILGLNKLCFGFTLFVFILFWSQRNCVVILAHTICFILYSLTKLEFYPLHICLVDCLDVKMNNVSFNIGDKKLYISLKGFSLVLERKKKGKVLCILSISPFFWKTMKNREDHYLVPWLCTRFEEHSVGVVLR